MGSEVVIGFAVTAVALFAMLAWSYHGIARIGERLARRRLVETLR